MDPARKDCEESSTALKHVIVQEMEVNTSLPTLGSVNLELDIEALTRVVREILEGVFEARIKEIGETLQARCIDC
ncbi:hypothetical protein J1N35_007763 [Gossypium stocksii]|uniref:Uncharacterized protein n=1 Tax=Gossypium stocksii TaxID=47602 RepID=A0A9D3W9T2_9ROSI|nr:hypothetical protein J1N35_007763 [Gossypium stocksii]